MADLYDVIVVGGGAVGAVAARDFAREGRRVLVLDREDDTGAAWRAAAGMLAPQIETDEHESLYELGVASRDRYATLAEELRADTGIDIGLWCEGIARIARDEQQGELLRERVARQRQQGQVSDWLDAGESLARWPWLREVAGALWSPRDGALDPVALVYACLEDARRHGASIVRSRVVEILTDGDRARGVFAGERYFADDTVICAGAWSGTLKGLPRPLSVEPVRGQMAALAWPEDVPPAILYSNDSYVVARGAEALIGSTMEYVGFDASVTEGGQQAIWADVRALCPPLAESRPSRTWAGLRPMMPDGLPALGPAPDLRGLWYATGHGRNGILLAAITATLLQQLLRGEPVHEHVASFAPDRFWRW